MWRQAFQLAVPADWKSAATGPATASIVAPFATVVSLFLYGVNARPRNRPLPPGERPRRPVIITPVIPSFPVAGRKEPMQGWRRRSAGLAAIAATALFAFYLLLRAPGDDPLRAFLGGAELVGVFLLLTGGAVLL